MYFKSQISQLNVISQLSEERVLISYSKWKKKKKKKNYLACSQTQHARLLLSVARQSQSIHKRSQTKAESLSLFLSH